MKVESCTVPAVSDVPNPPNIPVSLLISSDKMLPSFNDSKRFQLRQLEYYSVSHSLPNPAFL